MPTTGIDLQVAGTPLRLEVQRLAAAEPQPAAPLLVFLHEGLGSVSMWRAFPQRVCDALGAAGIVYSRPGYGRSTPRAPGERWGPDFMHHQAQQVLPALLDALHVDRADDPPWLLGHSDGATIALLHAARFPRQVGGLVLMAPHVFVEPLSLASIRRAREAYLGGELKSRLTRHHDDADSAFWGWNNVWLDPRFEHWNIEAELAPIGCPLLAIQGVDDEYGTLEQIHAIARRLPRAELLELPRCGHSPHRDQPDAVIAAVQRFVATRRRGANASFAPAPTSSPAA
ncbi:MAG: alpha/beta hydrolase [Nitrospira sp.]|nr:alpha/beta hydrolase [Nitrospira sp.]